MVGGVNNTNGTAAGTQTGKSAQSNLGKDDFLKLLITQLRFQDPMAPMEDKEFIAQMAQFNTLEEIRSLNKNLSTESDFSMLSQASSMIGRSVRIQQGDIDFTGKVLEVKRVDDAIKVVVQPDATVEDKTPAVQTMDLDTIQEVAG